MLSQFETVAHVARTAMIMTTQAAANSSGDLGKTAIEHASRSNKWLFFLYMIFIIGAAILTYLLWQSGNSVQNAIVADANARIGEATVIAATANERSKKLEADNLLLSAALETQKGQVATLQIAAADATKNVAILQKAASDAKASQQRVEIDLSHQKEKTARAEKTVLELQEKLADRILTGPQQNKLAAALKKFAGQEYEVVAYWDSNESLGIANRIHEALQLAQWKYNEEGSKSMMLGGMVGVKVSLHPNANLAAQQAADLLVRLLNGEGIQCKKEFQNAANPVNNIVFLNVGSKR